MIEITFTKEGLWKAAVYFIGLYFQLTEKKIALIEVQPNEIETYQDTIINSPNTMQDMKFKAPKQTFSDKMQLKFDLLEKFIFKQCVLDEKHKILEMPLLLAFSHHINSIVDPKHEFSFLMNLFTSKYPQFNITKTSTGKGIMYKGITLIDHLVNQKKTNKQSKSKKITTTNNNNPKPTNFESIDLQSSTDQLKQSTNSQSINKNTQSSNSPLINIPLITQLPLSIQAVTPSQNISFQSISLPKTTSIPINLSIKNTNKSPVLSSVVIPTFKPSIIPTFQPSVVPTFKSTI
jgi:hypothetical protein